MRGVDANRHQAVSTWIIEVLTITLTVLALQQYFVQQITLPVWATLFGIVLFVTGMAFLRIFLQSRVFGRFTL